MDDMMRENNDVMRTFAWLSMIEQYPPRHRRLHLCHLGMDRSPQ